MKGFQGEVAPWAEAPQKQETSEDKIAKCAF